MNTLLLLITMNIIIMILSISLNLVYAQQDDVDIIIEKPKWCNSANISYYYTFGDFQEEYKYPCATYM
jgi:hypothetical protein